MIKNKLTEVNVLVVYTYTLFDKIGEVVFFYAGVEQASKVPMTEMCLLFQ